MLRRLLGILFCFLVITSSAQGSALYVNDIGTGEIYSFDPVSGARTTFATGQSVNLGLAVDANHNVYSSNLGTGSINKFDSLGADLGQVLSGVSSPQGLAFDQAGNLYIAAEGSGRVIKVQPNGSTSNIAFVPGPWGVAIDGNGDLFAGTNFGDVYKLTGAGSSSSTPILSTGFYTGVFGMTFSGSGDLYLASHDSFGTIYKMAGGTGTASVFATLGSSYSALPEGLAFDDLGNLFAADQGGGRIFKISSTGDVTTFASGLSSPTGIAFDYTPGGPTVPEPASLALLSLGIAGLVSNRRRKAKQV